MILYRAGMSVLAEVSWDNKPPRIDSIGYSQNVGKNDESTNYLSAVNQLVESHNRYQIEPSNFEYFQWWSVHYGFND